MRIIISAVGASLVISFLAAFGPMALHFAGVDAPEGFEYRNVWPIALIAASASAVLFVTLIRARAGALFSETSVWPKGALWLACGGLALAALVRFSQTSGAAPNLDEATFMWLSTARTPAEVFQVWNSSSPHPPTYTLLLHFMMRISQEIGWLRFPCLAAGLATIWIAYKIGQEFAGRAAGVALAFLTAFSPAMIDLSRAIRNYSLAFAFEAAALWAFLVFLRTGRSRHLLVSNLFASAAISLHYSLAPYFVAIAAVAGLQLAIQRRGVKDWLRIGASYLPVAATGIFWMFAHIRHIAPGVVDWNRTHAIEAHEIEQRGIVTPVLQLVDYLAPTNLWPIVAALAAAGAVMLARRRRFDVLLVCVLPLLMSLALLRAEVLPFGGTRHSAHLFPSIFGLASVAIGGLPAAVSAVGCWLGAVRSSCAAAVRKRLRISAGEMAAEWSAAFGRRQSGRIVSGADAGWAAVIASAAATIFIAAALVDDDDPAIGYWREVVVSYRQADVAHAITMLDTEIDKTAAVLTTQGSFLTFALHHGYIPRPEPAPADTPPNAMAFEQGKEFVHAERRFIMTWGIGMFDAKGVSRELANLQKNFGIEFDGALCIPTEPHALRMTPAAFRGYREIQVDLDVWEESAGLLILLDAESVRNLRKLHRAGKF